MLVLLRENVENLGSIGDVVRVTDGYARNFLLPRKLVVVATEENQSAIEHQKKALAKKRQAQIASSQELSKKLEEYSCTIARKVGDNDKIFGSVTAGDIADALKASGFGVEKRMVHIDAPIKSLGVHPVTLKLEPEVSAIVKVWVVKE